MKSLPPRTSTIEICPLWLAMERLTSRSSRPWTVARTSASDRLLAPARSGLSRIAHSPVSSWLRMTAPIDAFSPDQAALLSLPTVTTLPATSTCATPGSWNSRSTSGDPAACSRFSKNNGPPGWTVLLTVNLHVSGSTSETSARMLTGGSTGRASDIFDNPPCSALAQGAQVVERINPRVMAVAPVDPDRIVTDARDHLRADIGPHRFRIEQLPATHLLDAE